MAYAPTPYRGPPGETRSTGTSVLLFLVTCGLYGAYWAFKTSEDIKRYVGVGVGGVVQLVIWLFASPVSGFLIPNDIKAMYEADGEQSPVNAMTGLWFFPGALILVGPIVWYVQVQSALNEFWARRGGRQGI